MRFAIVSLAALFGGILFFFSKRASASASETIPFVASNDLDSLFHEIGNQRNVDPLLLKAIAIVESNLTPDAVRNNPPNDVSVGLMQVLCIPDENGYCTNRFNVDGWDGMTFDALKDARVNLNIAAQILAWNISTYGLPRGIAVYNSWSARKYPLDGPFPNDAYVQKVYKQLAKLKGQT